MLKLFAIAPAMLEDYELERHIERLILTIESIHIELKDSWNHPAKQSVMPTLRRQLGETSSSLDAALYVWEKRMISMR